MFDINYLGCSISSAVLFCAQDKDIETFKAKVAGSEAQLESIKASLENSAKQKVKDFSTYLIVQLSGLAVKTRPKKNPKKTHLSVFLGGF